MASGAGLTGGGRRRGTRRRGGGRAPDLRQSQSHRRRRRVRFASANDARSRPTWRRPIWFRRAPQAARSRSRNICAAPVGTQQERDGGGRRDGQQRVRRPRWRLYRPRRYRPAIRAVGGNGGGGAARPRRPGAQRPQRPAWRLGDQRLRRRHRRRQRVRLRHRGRRVGAAAGAGARGASRRLGPVTTAVGGPRRHSPHRRHRRRRQRGPGGMGSRAGARAPSPTTPAVRGPATFSLYQAASGGGRAVRGGGAGGPSRASPKPSSSPHHGRAYRRTGCGAARERNPHLRGRIVEILLAGIYPAQSAANVGVRMVNMRVDSAFDLTANSRQCSLPSKCRFDAV